ncbi:hypothetical protein ASF04_23830 [Duganella sp. Leaf61]|nr:hypothetical protein ASF04_23830 [Duganella sp. Leaf61]
MQALLDQGVAEQTALDWLALRKAKRATVTQTVVETFCREANKAGMALGAVLSLCCSRGWTGFEAEWVLRAAAPAQSAAQRFDPTAHVNRNRPRQQ